MIKVSPILLEAEDAGFSVQRQGFESPMGRRGLDMLQRLQCRLTNGGTAPSGYLYSKLREAGTTSLILSSKREDMINLRDDFKDVNPSHRIMAELTWKIENIEFAIIGSGMTTDEAIEGAIALFYQMCPNGKFSQGETPNV